MYKTYRLETFLYKSNGCKYYTILSKLEKALAPPHKQYIDWDHFEIILKYTPKKYQIYSSRTYIMF
jgi:hypothetical protein